MPGIVRRQIVMHIIMVPVINVISATMQGRFMLVEIMLVEKVTRRTTAKEAAKVAAKVVEKAATRTITKAVEKAMARAVARTMERAMERAMEKAAAKVAGLNSQLNGRLIRCTLARVTISGVTLPIVIITVRHHVLINLIITRKLIIRRYNSRRRRNRTTNVSFPQTKTTRPHQNVGYISSMNQGQTLAINDGRRWSGLPSRGD